MAVRHEEVRHPLGDGRVAVWDTNWAPTEVSIAFDKAWQEELEENRRLREQLRGEEPERPEKD